MNILRGNHESASITRIYGFFEECNKFVMQVKTGIVWNYGNRLLIVSTACRLLLWLNKKYSVCMEVYHLSWFILPKSTVSLDQQIFLILGFFVIYYGLILSLLWKCGENLREEWVTSLDRRLSFLSWGKTSLIWFAEHIRWLRMDTNFLRRSS